MKKISILTTVLGLPFLAFAAQVTDASGLISVLGNLLNQIVPLIIGLAFIWFLWGVFQYVTAGSDEDKKTESRDTMIWGIVALFVMTSVWGIIQVLSGTFQFRNEPIAPPAVFGN